MPIQTISKKFLDELLAYDRYIILGHQDPDGDCLTSQIALASLLKRRGKETITVSPGPFHRSEIMELEPFFELHMPKRSRDGQKLREAVVVLDCSTIDRIGYLAAEIEGRPVIVIDHHDAGRAFADYALIDPEAPSVTYLVQLIYEALQETPSKEEAELLLFGLVTDTGFFRHVDLHGEAVLSSAARLSSYGAQLKTSYAKMYGNRSLASRRLAGRVMDRAALRVKGKVIVSDLYRSDEEELGMGERDSDTIYGQLQSIAGVDSILFFREEAEGDLSVGLRSRTHLDVGSLAAEYGGGGHKHAASFRSSAERKPLEKELIKRLERFYSEL